MNLPANDILLFVDVIKLGSFSKAAQKHHLTPPAVSKRISYLEAQMKTQLINRTTRRLVLTEAGEVLYNHCSAIALQLQQAHNAVQDLQKQPTGTLTISSPTNFSNLVMAPLIAEFSQQQPNINIVMLLDNSRKVPLLGEYDLAIRSGKLKDSSVISRKLTTVKFVICATPNYFKQQPKPTTPEQLSEHNCIDYNYREEGKIWTLKKAKKVFAIPVSGTIQSNNAFFIKNVCRAGGGLACLPYFMVKNEVENNTLTTCLEEYKTLEMPVSILYPYDRKTMPKKLRYFIDFLYSHIQGK